jgi:hypothetical protein
MEDTCDHSGQSRGQRDGIKNGLEVRDAKQNIPTESCVRINIQTNGGCAWAGFRSEASAEWVFAGISRLVRNVVVGIVIELSGAPGTSRVAVVVATATSSLSMTVMRIASLGHAWTQAGASPAARRLLHMSHLRTMPSAALYRGTS